MKSIHEIKTDLFFVKDYKVVVFGNRLDMNDMKHRIEENQFDETDEYQNILISVNQLRKIKGSD